MKLFIKRYWPYLWNAVCVSLFLLMAVQPNAADFGFAYGLPFLGFVFGLQTLTHYHKMSGIIGRRYPDK